MVTATALINSLILAITIVERWKSVSRLRHGFMTERWFIIVTGMLVLASVLMIVAFGFYKKNKETRNAIKSLNNYESGMS